MSEKLSIKRAIYISKCNYQQNEQEIQYYFEINLLLFCILSDWIVILIFYLWQKYTWTELYAFNIIIDK